MPEVVSIQRGTESIAAAAGTSFVIALGAEVDDSSSIVLHSSSIPSGTSRDYRHIVTVELEASGGASAGKFDQIRVKRNNASSAATFSIEWEVIEFDAASLGTNGVTYGSTTGFSAGGTIGETIAVTDIDSAVCTVCWSTSSFSYAFSDGSVRAEITSTTNLNLIASGTFAGTMEVAWQVIDFDAGDVAVQRGTVSVNASSGTTTSSGTDTITSVDTGASLLLGNGMNFPTVTSAIPIKSSAGLVLTNATTVTAYLGGYGSESAGKTLVIGYEVAEFLDGAAVQAGTLAFASGDSSKTTSAFSPALDQDRTSSWRVHPDLGNVDTNNTNPGGTGAVSFRQALDITTDVDSLTAYRNVTGIAVDLSWWQVIEFAAAGAGSAVALEGSLGSESSAAASLKVTRSFAAVSESQSAATAALAVVRAYAGGLVSESAAAAALAVLRTMAGSALSESALSAAVGIGRGLAGTAGGETDLSGGLSIARALSGAIESESDASASLKLGGLSGTVTSESLLVGALGALRAVAGQATSASDASAAVTMLRALVGQAASESLLSGALSAARAVAGLARSVSVLSGDLSTDTLVIVTPAERVIAIAGDSRMVTISAQDRTVGIADDRTITIH